MSTTSDLSTSMATATSTVEGGVDDFVESSEFVQSTVAKSDELMSTITDSISAIQASTQENLVDVEGMAGTLTESFETNKNNIINSALSSTKKASLELDAYLGSGTSDARSAVRRNMASSITEGVLTSSTQAISSLYNDYTQSVIDTTLAGKQANAATTNASAQAVASLTGQASSLLLGSASFVMEGYTSQLNAALALVDANIQNDQLTLQKMAYNQSIREYEESKSVFTLGSESEAKQAANKLHATYLSNMKKYTVEV